jgi:hypothetical protein
LYNIKSNNIETNLFYSPVATIDILNSTNIARMTDVHSDNLYNTNTLVCDIDIYSNNLRCNSFLSLSNNIILNQNVALAPQFVTPKENQSGYQIIGTIINNNTNITSNTLYNVSSINITPGVWSIFEQASYKCNSITGSNPLFS